LRDRPHRHKECQGAEDRTGDHGAKKRDIDVGVRVHDKKQPNKCADHENFAVREVEQVEHAEDQRVADRHQRIGGTEHQAVYELLVKHVDQCADAEKSCIMREAAMRALRVVAGVLRLRPTKRGVPAVTTAPIAAMSPCLMAPSAVFCVPPSGASMSTMSAALPAASNPLSRP